MKKYILLFAVLFAAITAKAYDVEYAGCYKSFKLEFRSVDENNDSVTLSELVTIPLEKDGVTNRKVGFFFLNSTVFNSQMHAAPTDEQPYDALITRTIATEGAMCVQVDGQGYGSSEGKPLTYLVNKLTARQSIDGLFAAMDYARANGIPVSDDYYTLNAGFSLDGGHAIAIQRYLEKYASADVKARFRLKKTICGGAPINGTASLRFALDNWLNKPQYSKILEGFYEDNAQGAFHAIDKSDVFTQDGTIHKDVVDGSSAAGRALWKAVGKENMDEDWLPETPITYLHWANDSTVTYENAQIALKAWGHDKFRILNQNLPDMKWNVSLMRTIHDVLNSYVIKNGHNCGAVDFFTGVIDGCLRDTLVANSYGRAMNFKDMFAVLFDIGSGANKDIPLNIPVKMPNGVFNIKSLGYCRFTGEVYDSLGTKKADIDVTVKPEVLDTLHSKLTDIDAKGYLHLPVDFAVTINTSLLGIPITGSCNDLYQTVENLSAIILHRTCPTAEDAEKFCNAFNDNIEIKTTVIGKVNIGLWYSGNDENGYYIEPYAITKSITGKKTYTKLGEFLKSLKAFGVDIDLDKYTTIDNQSFNVSNYRVMFHVTERNYGGLKFYADILKADSTVFGRVDFDITGVDMNDEGTRQTFKINFTVMLNSIPLKVTGTCKNLNDAVLAAILCYGNQSCPTYAAADAYAEAINQNVQMELYVAKVNDDGTYPEELTYMDYGPVIANTAQDEFGAYHVQYVVNWMGLGEITLQSVINLLLK